MVPRRELQTTDNGDTILANRQKIKTFLARIFHDYDLGDDEDIFTTGYVNSMFAMELVTFVEKEFHITVEDDDLELENFRTVNNIAGMIERKRLASSGA